MKLNVIIHVKPVLDHLRVIAHYVHKTQIDYGNMGFVLVNMDI